MRIFGRFWKNWCCPSFSGISHTFPLNSHCISRTPLPSHFLSFISIAKYSFICISSLEMWVLPIAVNVSHIIFRISTIAIQVKRRKTDFIPFCINTILVLAIFIYFVAKTALENEARRKKWKCKIGCKSPLMLFFHKTELLSTMCLHSARMRVFAVGCVFSLGCHINSKQ